MRQTKIHEIVRATWLTRPPRRTSSSVAAVTTATLLIGSLLAWSKHEGVSEKMAASGKSVFEMGEIWRLWSTLFVHADMGHLLSNSFLFFILGFFLYGHFGSAVFPLAALVAGGLVNALALWTYDPQIQLIGASGVVYWMGGMWLVLYARLSRQKNLSHRLLRTIGVALLLFMPTMPVVETMPDLPNLPSPETISPNVSHRTHFFGFVVGALSALPYYALNRRRFLAAEVREQIVEDDDPQDDLPGEEGFPPDHQSST